MSGNHFGSLDLNLLQAFHHIYLQRNLTVAADRLGLTQSALSHSLRKLRATFHDDLFVRTGPFMMPTVRAQALHDPISRIMETLELEVLALSSFDPTKSRRHFSLAMVDLAEVVFLPPLMRRLQSLAPGCTVSTKQVAAPKLANALEDGLIELAVGALSDVPETVYRQTMFHHDYVVIAWKHHPRLGKEMTWQQFSQEKHVTVAAGAEAHLQKTILAPRKIDRKIILTVGGFLSVPWLLKGTDWIATVPTRLGEALAQAAEIRHIPLPDSTPQYGLHLLWHQRQHTDPAHRWLRESIFEMMNGYPTILE